MSKHTEKKIVAFIAGLPMLGVMAIYLIGYNMFNMPFEDFAASMLTIIAMLVWLLVIMGLVLVDVAEE